MILGEGCKCTQLINCTMDGNTDALEALLPNSNQAPCLFGGCNTMHLNSNGKDIKIHLYLFGAELIGLLAVQRRHVNAARDEHVARVDGDGFERALDAVKDGRQQARAQLHRQWLVRACDTVPNRQAGCVLVHLGQILLSELMNSDLVMRVLTWHKHPVSPTPRIQIEIKSLPQGGHCAWAKERKTSQSSTATYGL